MIFNRLPARDAIQFICIVCGIIKNIISPQNVSFDYAGFKDIHQYLIRVNLEKSGKFTIPGEKSGEFEISEKKVGEIGNLQEKFRNFFLIKKFIKPPI